jgi:cytochrome c oxidase subunit I
MGIVCEIIANNTRKPIWGYKSLVYSVLTIGFLSFIVWAHHMYLTGMGTKISAFFQATTMIISIPSVIILTCLFISLWGGSIRFNTPMLFALAFLPMFGIGGLTGLPLGFNASDVYLHDTYYVIAHFHYVVAPGTIFALFAGIYYWFPKMTGRKMNEFWGRVHFWCSFVFMNLVFMPMFAQGIKGMLRRMADGGANYSAARVPGRDWRAARHHHGTCTSGFFGRHRAGHRARFRSSSICSGASNTAKKVGDNPWHATTLEWQTPTPPPHGNFDTPPHAFIAGPYEYSVPGHATISRRKTNPDPRPHAENFAPPAH